MPLKIFLLPPHHWAQSAAQGSRQDTRPDPATVAGADSGNRHCGQPNGRIQVPQDLRIPVPFLSIIHFMCVCVCGKNKLNIYESKSMGRLTTSQNWQFLLSFCALCKNLQRRATSSNKQISDTDLGRKALDKSNHWIHSSNLHFYFPIGFTFKKYSIWWISS